MIDISKIGNNAKIVIIVVIIVILVSFVFYVSKENTIIANIIHKSLNYESDSDDEEKEKNMFKYHMLKYYKSNIFNVKIMRGFMVGGAIMFVLKYIIFPAGENAAQPVQGAPQQSFFQSSPF